MSWFDGYIPDECLHCFYRGAEGWKMKPDAMCDDSCDYFLALFPLIKDGRIDHEKMELLELNPADPEWYR